MAIQLPEPQKELTELSQVLRRKVSVPDEVAHALREAIFKGSLRPGERIVEGRIAKQLGIGYPTVREALKTLQMEGLVRRQPNQGCSVTELSLEEQNQIFYLRVELESMAAELAVRNRKAWTSEGPSLSRILTEFRQAANKENLEEFLRADIEFHKTVWRFSGNAFLERALSQITVPQLAFGAIKVLSHPGRSWISIVADHEDVARSLVGGGEDRAKRVVRRMLQEYWEKTMTIHAPNTRERP